MVHVHIYKHYTPLSCWIVFDLRVLIMIHYFRWRAWMIISKIPEAEREEVHLKASAAEALDGRRREWGCKRRWKGDYMSMVSLF